LLRFEISNYGISITLTEGLKTSFLGLSDGLTGYLDKIRRVLDFQGFNEVISEIFFSTSEIFYTKYTLDISLRVKYNYTKPNKEART
jgi:hypothetical protein